MTHTCCVFLRVSEFICAGIRLWMLAEIRTGDAGTLLWSLMPADIAYTLWLLVSHRFLI